MAEIKRRNEEITQKNEEEILALPKENEEMKRKFVEEGSSAGPTNLVERSFTPPPAPRLSRAEGKISHPRA